MKTLPPSPQFDPTVPTYDSLLAEAHLPHLEARALLEHASGQRREWLIAHGDESASSSVALSFRSLCARRLNGEPIAYLIGWREFYGRRFEVGPDVLIPRPETELLIERSLRLACARARVIDLGTGSGCIALTLACERTDLNILATDQSSAALHIAQQNAQRLCPDHLTDGRLQFQRSDWWEQVAPKLKFELIVSNPPYIERTDAHLEQGDLRFEPRMALTDENDGLRALHDIARDAASRLAPGGYLLLEHGYSQGAAVSKLMREFSFVQVETHFDAAGLTRISQAKMP